MDVAISQDHEVCCPIMPIAGIQMPASLFARFHVEDYTLQMVVLQEQQWYRRVD